VNRARFICPSLFQGRTLNPRAGKSQWQVSALPAHCGSSPTSKVRPSLRQVIAMTAQLLIVWG
jgi:hypothetical protein